MNAAEPMIRLTDVDVCFYIQENGHVSMKEFLLNILKVLRL